MNKVITAAAGHPDISIIVSVYNEEESLGLFFETIRKTMERADGYTYEIICIDDGSTDGTYNLLEQYATEDFRVKVLKFSRNFGKEYGLMAGLKHCRGRAAVPIDVDLQDPPELILQFIQKWEEGYDMVYGIRNDRRSDSWLKRWTAKLFYKAYNLMTRSPIPYNAGDYRLIDRKIIDAILELKERNIFMKGIFGWTGFKSCGIKYVRQKRQAGVSKWNYWRLWNFALDGITASTTLPLRIWTYLGSMLSFLGLLYALYIIARTIMYGADVPGYASLLVFILLVGGVQMIILGILGEYIGRIFIEVKRRPLYIVEKKVKDGGRVLIYTSWVKIDTQVRLKKVLEEKGYRVAVLEQRVKPEKREEWVEKKLQEGLDVLITNPSLVETGLDLNAFTTLIFYNIGYNLFTFRQSSRRSWRINQTAPRIEVYILYYKGVMQARAIRLMATKLAVATLVEGNFSDEGLAAKRDCADMTSELAKELTKGIRDEVEDVAAMYKKMAILKDGTEADDDLSDYVIMDDDAPKTVETVKPVETPKVVSISDKIKQAMLLAKQAKGIKESKQVNVQNDYSYVDSQLSLFDILDKAS